MSYLLGLLTISHQREINKRDHGSVKIHHHYLKILMSYVMMSCLFRLSTPGQNEKRNFKGNYGKYFV